MGAGLPGIGLQQGHRISELHLAYALDTYERIVPEDVKQAATEIASMVWTVANLDKMIPGSPKNKCRYHPAAAAANDVWAELG
jgi:hypothetical protein